MRFVQTESINCENVSFLSFYSAALRGGRERDRERERERERERRERGEREERET